MEAALSCHFPSAPRRIVEFYDDYIHAKHFFSVTLPIVAMQWVILDPEAGQN